MRTVKEVAELSGTTVRTLHHYDEIGLLRPSARSDAGYRLYSHADLERLQEILGWRELGFSLAEVTALIDDPHYDRAGALRRQRALVDEQAQRLDSLSIALDNAIAAADAGADQPEENMFQGFHNEYEDEARERWGGTREFEESLRRTRAYGQSEWRSIRDEGDAIAAEFAALMEMGADPAGPDANALALRHRAYLSRWFYDCSPEIHRGLAVLYVSDPRFTKKWDQHARGLASYVHDAIVAA